MGYGLTFGAASSDRINCGTGASHDGLAVGTIAVIGRPTSLGVTYDPRFFQKSVFGNGNNRLLFFLRSAGNLRHEIQRPGADFLVQAAVTNFAAYALSSWMILAATWDFSGVASDQRLYIGNQTTAPAEPSAYATQTLGDGGTADDSAEDWIVGNNKTFTAAFLGDLAVQGVWSRALSAGDLAAWFKNPSDVGANLVMLHFFGLNGSTGTQLDRSGNGNDGTVTGASAASDQLALALHGRLAGQAGASRRLVGRGLAP